MAIEDHIDSLLQEALAKGGCFRFRARGISMHPLVRTGDELEVEPVDPEKLRKGDLVLYRQPYGVYVVHRLVRYVERNGQRFILTRGDNVRCLDMPVALSKVRGRVTSIRRHGSQCVLSGVRPHALGILLSMLAPWGPWHLSSSLRGVVKRPWKWFSRFFWRRRDLT